MESLYIIQSINPHAEADFYRQLVFVGSEAIVKHVIFPLCMLHYFEHPPAFLHSPSHIIE